MNEIKDYIEKSRKAGYNDEQIKEALKKSGWNDQQINEALSPNLPPTPEKSILEPTPMSQPSNSTEKKGTNTLAIISLIVSFIVPLVGLILGIIALSHIRKSGEKGKGFAIAAIILNVVQILFLVLTIVAYFGVLDPNNLTPERCAFPVGLDCIDRAAITSDSITLALKNNQGAEITLDSVSAGSCSSAQAAPSTSADFQSLPVTIQNYAVLRIRLTECDNGNTGDSVSKIITVTYTNTNSGLKNEVSGDVRGMVT